jgi:hypothetical protein
MVIFKKPTTLGNIGRTSPDLDECLQKSDLQQTDYKSSYLQNESPLKLTQKPSGDPTTLIHSKMASLNQSTRDDLPLAMLPKEEEV